MPNEFNIKNGFVSQGNSTVNGDITIFPTNGAIISGNTSSSMLRITQIGSANAIVVEDTTNIDATPFVVDSEGRVGIGTSSPSYFLEAVSTGTNDSIMLFNGGSSGNANLVSRANTIIKLPTIVMSDNNDSYSVSNSFYIGLDRSSSALYSSRNDAIYVNNYLNKGHYFITNNGGSKGVRMSILSNGDVGIGVISASTKLQVSGNTLINGTLSATTFNGSGTQLNNIPISGVTNLQSSLDSVTSFYVEPSSTGITWNVSGTSTNYKLTLTANTTLNLSNVRNGDYGTIILTQDSGGNRTVTLGTVNGGSGNHKVVNGGNGSITLTTTSNAIDILSFTYDGTNMYWNTGLNYT